MSVVPLISPLKETFIASPVNFSNTPFQKDLYTKKFYKYISKMIVPSSKNKISDIKLRFYKKNLVDTCHARPVKLITPDGVKLDAAYIPGIVTSKEEAKSYFQYCNNKTIIFFNNNGSVYEVLNCYFEIKLDSSQAKLKIPIGNLDYFQKKGWNIFLFNYRGTGKSKGEPTRQGLWLDGEAAYQYVHKHLKVPKKNILLYGHSLGGAIATLTASMHPKVNICNDRSFSTLSKVVSASFPILGNVPSLLLYQYKWEMKLGELWNRILGKKCIIYHPQDEIIKPKASLKSEACKNNKTNTHVIVLNNDNLSAYYQELLKKQTGLDLIKFEIKACDKLAKKVSNHCRDLLSFELEQVLNFFTEQ